MKPAQIEGIIGAGLAGLIAAHAWPQAAVLEASPQPRAAHRAVLRFRSDAVARLTGVEFRRVLVRKGLWLGGEFIAPNIAAANLYAAKVTGGLMGERSIWRLDAAERFVAPDTLYEQLLDAVGARVMFDTPADFAGLRTAVVSTAPLPVTARALGLDTFGAEFKRASIFVRRWKVPRCDLFQTVYFPDPDLSVYRASITGDTLIVEFVTDRRRSDDWDELLAVERAFGIDLGAARELEAVEQRYGKIEPIHDTARKALLFKLTHEHRIFSLGRFATWRNILLDDVVDDIAVIKRLARSGAAGYDLQRAATQ